MCEMFTDRQRYRRTIANRKAYLSISGDIKYFKACVLYIFNYSLKVWISILNRRSFYF